VSPVKYELGFYIPEDDILHSHRRENLKSCYRSVMFMLSVCNCFWRGLEVNVIVTCRRNAARMHIALALPPPPPGGHLDQFL
jgi:hypothetical protein